MSTGFTPSKRYAETGVDAEVLARLVRHIQGTIGVVGDQYSAAAYDHMGAVVSDAGLQAATNYQFVVAPRVQRLLVMWPTAATTTAFLDKAFRFGLSDVLRWRHTEKLSRIVRLGLMLQSKRVETIDDLRVWMARDTSAAELRSVPGVGPKTVDYIAGLVGLPAVAVDRHVMRFVEQCGVRGQTYQEVRTLVVEAAGQLDCSPLALDRAIWGAMSAGANS